MSPSTSIKEPAKVILTNIINNNINISQPKLSGKISGTINNEKIEKNVPTRLNKVSSSIPGTTDNWITPYKDAKGEAVTWIFASDITGWQNVTADKSVNVYNTFKESLKDDTSLLEKLQMSHSLLNNCSLNFNPTNFQQNHIFYFSLFDSSISI